jgi:hypothetical protein
MIFSWVSLPDPSALIGYVSTWSGGFFNSFWAIVAAVSGITIGCLFVAFLIGKMVGGVKSLLVRRRAGRGRRR